MNDVKLDWSGPGFYVPLHFGTVERWVLVSSNKDCNADSNWSWFASEQSAKIWLGLEQPAKVANRQENLY